MSRPNPRLLTMADLHRGMLSSPRNPHVLHKNGFHFLNDEWVPLGNNLMVGNRYVIKYLPPMCNEERFWLAVLHLDGSFADHAKRSGHLTEQERLAKIVYRESQASKARDLVAAQAAERARRADLYDERVQAQRQSAAALRAQIESLAAAAQVGDDDGDADGAATLDAGQMPAKTRRPRGGRRRTNLDNYDALAHMLNVDDDEPSPDHSPEAAEDSTTR